MTKLNNNSHFDFIDALRGVAILMVMAVHVSQSIDGLSGIVRSIFSWGAMGVPLFFVVSAYTLCVSANNKGLQGNPLYGFYVRRLFRIAPMYYFGILVYLIFHFIQNDFEVSHPYSIHNIIANILFYHGFFEPAYNNIVPGGWSIGTEMAFYLIFPLLYQFIIKTDHRSTLVKVVSMIIGSVLMTRLLLFTDQFDYYFIYHNLINMISVFLLGILYFHYASNKPLINSKVMSIGLVFLTIPIAFFVNQKVVHISLNAFSAGVAFIFLMDFFRKLNFKNLGFLLVIGRNSYSIYILHFIFSWPISRLLVSSWLVNVNSILNFSICFVLSLVGSLLCSFITKKYIEDPGINLGKKFSS